MTDFSNYTETEVRDWAFQGTQMDTPPTTLYVSLHTGAPGEDGSANEVSTSNTGYARQSVAVPGGWDTPNPNEAANANVIEFGPATSDWGDVSHAAIWDAQTGGDCLFVGDVSTTKTVETDDFARYGAGEITVTLD